MLNRSRSIIVFGLLSLFLCAPLALVKAQSVDAMQRGFERPPDDARPMMRWWWYGPAVENSELEREMRLMKAGGIGGFEVQPVYPLSLDDPARGIKNTPFLSDEHLAALKFTLAKARELGLRMDLTLGSGWPFGGPSVSVQQAAGALRVERVKISADTRRVPLPNLGAGEKLLAAFLVTTDGTKISKITEATDLRDGALQLANIGDANEVQFYVSSKTGMQVKRPAIGAEGFVVNHMDAAATDHYLKNVGDRLLSAFGNERPYAIFCDSFEVYNQDWTDDLLEEFKRRRGYDLKPLLPALVGDIGAQTADVRYDWGITLTELLNERFLAPIQAWSKRNGTKFRVQNYGIPPAVISSSAYADLPEGEGPQWKIVRAARWASSASHIYGKNVTSSETWTWLHSPVFRATPLDMKAEADLHFLQGINQLIGHGWPYTPPGVEYPGWRFYAAGVYNEKNPWWTVMPDLMLYLQRTSYMLRQGQPANDVALYLPNSDAYAHMSAGKVHMIDMEKELLGTDIMPRILEAGYNLDFFDDGTLAQVGKVEGNSLQLGANKYRVIVLPGVERVPLATMKKLEAFVRGGGVLIATRRLPDTAPGAQTSAADKTEVRAIAQRLFDGANAPARFVHMEDAALTDALVKGFQPDMAITPSVAEIGFIHRHTPDAEIYFVANTSNTRRVVDATFRVTGANGEVWNPLDGKVAPVVMSKAQPRANGATLTLDLEPFGSRLVIFSQRAARAEKSMANGAMPPAPPALDLSRDWQVTFGDGGTPVMLDALRSWTDNDDTRYFSGSATYEKTINVPPSFLQNGITARLDFGEGKALDMQGVIPGRPGIRAWYAAPIREAAVIYVNGQRAGSLWCPPYSLELNGLLKNGENKIRIVVSNLALNYMAGRKLPDYRLLNLRYGERFQPQDMDKVQPVEAGLTGQIQLFAIPRSRLK